MDGSNEEDITDANEADDEVEQKGTRGNEEIQDAVMENCEVDECVW